MLRRVILIITIECLAAIINSWFVDIILSIKYCKRSVAIGDDCPNFLRRYHPLLAFFDLVNSMSNIVLYCFAAKRFRHELERMIKGWINVFRQRLPCFCYLKSRKFKKEKGKINDEQSNIPSEFSTAQLKSLKRHNNTKHEYIQLQPVNSSPVIF